MTFPKLAIDISGMPLAALQAVVLDTETTGLDVEKDRVIEFGATRIECGKLDAGQEFTQLVNPGMSIPESSQQIHRLTDDLVADAPAFPKAMELFIDKMAPDLVLGYSLGFDMAVLKTEHERNGLIWNSPRTLDVAHAVRLLNPQLPNLSLDVVAKWLGLKIEDRHRALADAVATAEVFLKLVPRLKEKEIVTFAQLERAVSQLSERLVSETEVGWLTPGSHKTPETDRIAGLARLDSFPYRHRVSEVMRKAMFIDSSSSLSQAVAEMVRHKVSSLFVRGMDKAGILTERDILRTIKDHGKDAMDQDLTFALKDSLVSVEPDEFVYRAMLKMSSSGVRHIAITDKQSDIVGILTPRNLLRAQAEEAISLGEQIDEADTTEELGRVWAELVTVANALWVEDVDVRDIAAIISRELRALTRRACELAESSMLEQNLGKPPVDYAMLVLGSGGRGESLLAMDQDNAIILQSGERGGKEDSWAKELGTRVSDMLASVGLAYCKGGVMASNDAWRTDLQGWRSTVDKWVSKASPEDFLSSDIFFDGVWVHGDRKLARKLMHEALVMVRSSSNFLKFLALNASKNQPQLGPLGRIRTKKGRIDLKLHGLLPIIGAARAMALRHGISDRATVARLRACVELGHANDHVVEGLVEAHRILLGLILSQEFRDISDGLPASSNVEIAALSGREKDNLKWALSKIPNVSVLLGTPA